MNGLHLTADLHGCPMDTPALQDADTLRALCEAAVAEAGLTAVASLFHRFEPELGIGACGPADGEAQPASGVTGVVLLAESHVAVHTWPELAAVTLDVYVCNRSGDHSARAEALCERLVAAFRPSRVLRQRLRRGDLPPAPPELTPPPAT